MANIAPAGSPNQPVTESPVLTGTFLTWASFDPGLANPFDLLVSVGGAPAVRLLVDTGSTGIVIGKEHLGANDGALDPQPPVPGYSSSGMSYTGQWVWTTVTVTGANGVSLVTGRIAVFAADQTGVSMMGVGVRGTSGLADASNPFLLMAAHAGFRTGYILTPRGVHLGYSDVDVATFETFSFSAAEPVQPLATVSLTPAAGSGLQPYTATTPFLLDTGIDYMIMTPVEGQALPDSGYEIEVQAGGKPRRQLISGVGVEVSIGPRSIWSYNTTECPAYQPGPANPAVPVFARFAVPSPAGILNTGRHLLGAYDYLVDLESNVLGLRQRLSEG